jgi:hypothetical protein
MPSVSPGPLVTERDLELLTALDRVPLTAAQMFTLSETFAQPFTTERRVRERLHTLCLSHRIRTFRYATAGPGAPNYYLLTRVGYEILHGPGAPTPTRHFFDPVAIARQHHTHSLAQMITHMTVAAHRTGLRFGDYFRESALLLQIGDEVLRPDAAFTLVTDDSRELHFVVELDNSSERVRSDKDTDSWQRKLRLYEALQDAAQKRFRVLVITTRRTDRLAHILSLASCMAKNPQRALVYGIALEDFLREHAPLHAPCFRDHHQRHVALVSVYPSSRDGVELGVVRSIPAAAPLRS